MMTRREATAALFATAAMAGTSRIAGAQELKAIALPKAQMEGGMPLMSALKLRHSTREYSDRPLSAQTLSGLLWAGHRHLSGDGQWSMDL